MSAGKVAIFLPIAISPFAAINWSNLLEACNKATPPPTIIPSSKAALVANNASSLFSKNISNFLSLMDFESKKSLYDKNDEIIKATLVCAGGKILIK